MYQLLEFWTTGTYTKNNAPIFTKSSDCKSQEQVE